MRRKSVKDNHVHTQQSGGGSEHCLDCGAFKTKFGDWNKVCTAKNSHKICPCCKQEIR